MNELPQPSTAAAILFVDDEPSILSALRRSFRSSGHQMFFAESGAAGLELLETTPVDIVVSDMRMPSMDGATFLQNVRERWPQTVRLLLTGQADVNSIIEAINRGEIYRYITKPWDDNDILLLIRRVMERKQLEQEKQRLEELTVAQNGSLKALAQSLEEKVVERTAELAQANYRLSNSFVVSLKILSGLIEMRGENLAGHARRVAELSRKLALQMGLDAEPAQEIFVAGLLHEVGKLGFPDSLLMTPVAAMASNQASDYRQHVIRGEQLLMPLLELQGAAANIGAQLERFDGTGFPQRLAERAINIGARILAVASDFDNLQIGVLAARKLGTAEARELIERGKGKRYDPTVVEALFAVLDEEAKNAGAVVQDEKVLVGAIALAPDMVLSKDLIGPTGVMMLSIGHQLDQRMIDRILAFEQRARTKMTIHIRVG